MKLLLLIATLILNQVSFGQYNIEIKVQNEFDSLLNKLFKDGKEISNKEKYSDGLAIIQELKIDTLNIKEFKPAQINSNATLALIDNDGNEIPELPKDTSYCNQCMPCYSFFKTDTLVIGSLFGLYSGGVIFLKIVGNNVICSISEYSTNENIYRQNLNDPKSAEIWLQTEIRSITLNKLPKKEGEIFFGKAILMSQPFYHDDNEFTNGYIHKRYTITYLFKSKLNSQQ